MKKAVSGLFLLAVLISCGSSQNFGDKSIRAATDTPVAFEPKNGMSFDESSCKSPLVDPRSGVEIIMVTAQGGLGDYRVPSGRYGVKNNELLRLNCSTGEVIGIVKD